MLYPWWFEDRVEWTGVRGRAARSNNECLPPSKHQLTVMDGESGRGLGFVSLRLAEEISAPLDVHVGEEGGRSAAQMPTAPCLREQARSLVRNHPWMALSPAES